MQPTGFNPRAAFGLAATAVAMKAKAGLHLTQRDQLNLAEICLTHVGDCAGARAATTAFLQGCRADPEAAGVALQEFVFAFTDDIDPRTPEQALADLKQEAAIASWRDREDLK